MIVNRYKNPIQCKRVLFPRFVGFFGACSFLHCGAPFFLLSKPSDSKATWAPYRSPFLGTFSLQRPFSRYKGHREMAKNLEDFEPVYGEAIAEWETPTPLSNHPFLFYAHVLDSSRLRFQVSDFHASTWEAVRNLRQLEDLRDTIGIGGSWDDFIDYLKSSVSSGNVKLVLGVLTKSANVHGATHATLTAQKSKGMPCIFLSLEKLTESADGDAMGNISLQLFKAFKSKCHDVVKEQGSTFHLSKALDSERDKNRKLQDQLDALAFSSKRKHRKLTPSESIALPSSGSVKSFDTMKASKTELSSETQSSGNPPSQFPITTHRVIPASRKTPKVRGVLLQDSEEHDNN